MAIDVQAFQLRFYLSPVQTILQLCGDVHECSTGVLKLIYGFASD